MKKTRTIKIGYNTFAVPNHIELGDLVDALLDLQPISYNSNESKFFASKEVIPIEVKSRPVEEVCIDFTYEEFQALSFVESENFEDEPNEEEGAENDGSPKQDSAPEAGSPGSEAN